MGRREDVLKKAVEQLNKKNIEAMYCQGDVRNFKSCEEASLKVYEKFGKIDTLINGAAGNFLAAAEGLKTKINFTDLRFVRNHSPKVQTHLQLLFKLI
jgi:2,4-dienoyl-CoA reductase [(3E)-enoyl-CoA-producing], peroxisomal